MKSYNKLKISFGLIGALSLTIIPLSLTLISCSNNKYDSINGKFVENIKNPNITLEGVDQNTYNKAKYISNNFYERTLNSSEYTDMEILNWLNNASEQQIEDLLFINFNRNFDNFSFNNDNKKLFNSINKQVYEISDVEYNSQTHYVNFNINVYTNKYINLKLFMNVSHELKFNYTCQYNVTNMKLIPAAKKSFLPKLSFEIDDIKIKSTNINFVSNIFECWDFFNNALEIAKNNGLSYDGKKIEGEYYNQLKNELYNEKKYYYDFDDNMNLTKNFVWDKNMLTSNFDNNKYNDIFYDDAPWGIYLDLNNFSIIQYHLYISTFLIMETNNNNNNSIFWDFNLIK